MLADGSFEALQTDEEKRSETELDSPVPKDTLPAPTEDRRARQRSVLEQLDPHLGGHRILLDDVADGSHTLDEFMDQLTSTCSAVSRTGALQIPSDSGILNSMAYRM